MIAFFAWLTGKYLPRRMPDGSTLQQLPPEQLRDNYDAWAVQTWTAWRESGVCYRLEVVGDDQKEEVCPGCYYACITGDARYMATNHPDAAARRRWSRTAEIDHRKFEALGDCQCGKRRQRGRLQLSRLAQYFPPR